MNSHEAAGQGTPTPPAEGTALHADRCSWLGDGGRDPRVRVGFCWQTALTVSSQVTLPNPQSGPCWVCPPEPRKQPIRVTESAVPQQPPRRSAPASLREMLERLLSRDLAPHGTPAGIRPRRSRTWELAGGGGVGSVCVGAGPAPRRRGRREAGRGAGLPGPVDRRCRWPDGPSESGRLRMLRAQGRARSGGARPPALQFPVSGSGRRVSPVSV